MPDRIAAGAAVQAAEPAPEQELLALVADTIVHHADDAFYVLDGEWRFVFVNQAAERYLRRSRQELLGRVLWDEFPEAIGTEFEEGFRRASATGESVTIDRYYAPLETWFDVNVHPRGDSLVVHSRNVNSRRLVEEALRQSEARYRSLTDDVLDSSAVGTFILDADFRVVWINQAIERYFGLTRDEVLGRLKRDLLSDRLCRTVADAESFTATLLATYEDNTYVESFQCHVEPADGRPERWLEHWSQPIRGGIYAGGRIEHYYDITEIKRTEQELQESRSQWRKLFKHSPSPNWVYDSETLRIVEVNDAAVAHYGYSRDEFLSMTIEDLRPPEDLPWLRNRLAGAPNTGVLRSTARHITGDGRTIQVEVGGQNTTWAGRKARLVSVEDVTERTRTREALEQASDAKGRFLSLMGHELRTPLTAIVGFADLIESESAGPLTDKQKEQIGSIRTGAWHLNRIVEDVLSYARNEAAREVIYAEPTDVVALANDAVAFIEPLAARQQLAFHLELPDQPLMVNTDRGKLRQILINLLGNAIKFTPDGTVSLTVAADGGLVRFEVRDTGPGIAPDALERIFEPFEQGDSPDTRLLGGTGLGLAVSRELARLLGGDVLVESKVGQGSIFTLHLPLGARK